MAGFPLDPADGDAFAASQDLLLRTCVVGAGVMGTGIAFTCACHGLPVRLKDVRASALQHALQEMERLLARRTDAAGAARARASVRAQLDYQGFECASVVIEAVVDNLGIKNKVLGEVEGLVAEDAVLLSNTSSLRIDDLAAALQRPQNFAGMHFFNPAPVMPLVEVIRGRQTSDYAVQTAVKQALAMGKIPIVVRDGPGFLVNRILMAYIHAFLRLLAEGVDYQRIDRAAEAFGWPMGPAYLEDVVGLDVGTQSCDLIFASYPERMPALPRNAFRMLLGAGLYGQKGGAGFYLYQTGADGRPERRINPQAQRLLRERLAAEELPMDEAQIIDRLMLPMIVEAVHALQESVVTSAMELDRALSLGIGFPPLRGGALRYADELGAAEVLARCERYRHLGEAYEAPLLLRQLARDNGRFHATGDGR
ncbi:3-hydroxyacyl-CoA dehydrogenase NAD-binding domain-containing protein [Pseudomonas sp. GCM10022186]|uniref:3-hydroxyacyl-CoA dehydrogenase NAD-binding domain-containing protein n=1 Tax=Pseudomonas sp. GCM10022186 TaxID=3252650 RepID=UPI0036231AD8